MKKNLIWGSLCLAAPLFFAACDEVEEGNNDPQKETPSNEPEGFCDTLKGWNIKQRQQIAVPLVLTGKEQEAINKSNAFANQLISKLIKKDTNIVVSPISLEILFGMIMNGQNETALNETKDVLGLGDLSLADINILMNKISTSLNSNLDSTSYFETQNAIWSNNILFKKKFVETVQNNYSASIANLDFNQEGASDTINNWCKEATRGMINHLVSKEELKELAAVMANACYFKAEWGGRFIGMTKDNFYDRNGNLVKDNAYMMCDAPTHLIKYEETDSYELARIPYGNGSFYMDVVLPKMDDEQFILNFDWTKVNPQKFKRMNDYGWPVSFELYMPRFKADNHHSLLKMMEDLGMKNIKATLSGMNDALYISKLGQLANIAVDEEGTKASAVSYALLETVGEHITHTMYINRPFYYAIREAKTGLILFAGYVVVPDDYVEPVEGKYY
ncbi:MAG: hypothetical protein KBT22_03940 [Bacteroidales bacterium]|nr:hypothetical protein [Candidatus Scybalocola fimicaballi]